MSIERRTAAKAAWWIWAIVAFLALSAPILMFVGRSLMKPGDVVISAFAIAAVSRPSGLPAWKFVAWIGMWLWIPTAGAIPLLLLLFPSGRLPSRRFSPVVWIGATGVALATLATAVNPIRFEINGAVTLDNPFGLGGSASLLSVLIGVSAAMIFPASALAVASLVVRYRRGSGH